MVSKININCPTVFLRKRTLTIERNNSAAAPPVNVEATHASGSATVVVSWSPPSDRPATITGYRIFYGNGVNASVPSTISGISLSMNEDSVGTVRLCLFVLRLIS